MRTYMEVPSIVHPQWSPQQENPSPSCAPDVLFWELADPVTWAPIFLAGAHLSVHGSSSHQVTYQVPFTKCFLFLHLFFSIPGTKDPPCHQWLWHKGTTLLHFDNFCGSDFSPLHCKRLVSSSEITRGPADMGNNFLTLVSLLFSMGSTAYGRAPPLPLCPPSAGHYSPP